MNRFDYGTCQCCGEYCNNSSQQCGHCMRSNTIRSFNTTNLQFTLRYIHTKIQRYMTRQTVFNLEAIKEYAGDKLRKIPGQMDLIEDLNNTRNLEDWTLFMSKLKYRGEN